MRSTVERFGAKTMEHCTGRLPSLPTWTYQEPAACRRLRMLHMLRCLCCAVPVPSHSKQPSNHPPYQTIQNRTHPTPQPFTSSSTTTYQHGKKERQQFAACSHRCALAKGRSGSVQTVGAYPHCSTIATIAI